jgi:hypothetical protein
VAISPDVVSLVRRRFNCCDLFWRSVIRNVARKASSVTLTTGMVATPSRRGWSVLIGYLPKNRTKSSVKPSGPEDKWSALSTTFISKRPDSSSPLIGAKSKTISASYSEATGWLTARPSDRIARLKRILDKYEEILKLLQ